VIDGINIRQNNSTSRTPIIIDGNTSNHGPIFLIKLDLPDGLGELSSVIGVPADTVGDPKIAG
jgi:hypothetical protein